MGAPSTPGEDLSPRRAGKGCCGRARQPVAFDLLAINGQDLRELPLLERKEQLQTVIDGSNVHYVEHLEAHGEALFAKVCELDLEGIVAKQADSPYRAGRQKTWLKVKNAAYSRQEALGFRDSI